MMLLNDPFLMVVALGLVGMAVVVWARALKRAPRFEARALLNKSEQRVHRALLDFLNARPDLGLAVHCQVSYGEFLSSPSRKTFLRINAKRADFLIVDRAYHPVLVIEFQGSGHYGSTRDSRRNAEARDRDKRAATRAARVAFLEVSDPFQPAELRRALVERLAGHQAGRQAGHPGR